LPGALLLAESFFLDCFDDSVEVVVSAFFFASAGLGTPCALFAWVETPNDDIATATPVVMPVGVVRAPAFAV
jgi:hypothetical protein